MGPIRQRKGFQKSPKPAKLGEGIPPPKSCDFLPKMTFWYVVIDCDAEIETEWTTQMSSNYHRESSMMFLGGLGSTVWVAFVESFWSRIGWLWNGSASLCPPPTVVIPGVDAAIIHFFSLDNLLPTHMCFYGRITWFKDKRTLKNLFGEPLAPSLHHPPPILEIQNIPKSGKNA